MVTKPRYMTRVASVALVLLAAMAGPAACAQPPADPQPGRVFVSLHVTDGIAARDVLFTITGYGKVLQTGSLPRTLVGGEAGAAKLYGEIVATGIYDVKPGDYPPANICCDRQTYDLTLTKDGRTYRFVTMDGSETAPGPLLSALALVQESIGAAR